MATDLIRYDLLVQDAIRGVVRSVLIDAARDGLPGEHHFFITFRTQAPGVRLSARMREQYPNEMTIILQHQFWNLSVSDKAFEVGLSFQGKGETLLVPFDALTGFADPSVPFSFKFELEPEVVEANANDTQAQPSVPEAPAPQPAPAALPSPKPAAKPAAVKPAEKPVAAERKTDADKIVSIDAFRKKP
jgi:hypothetical protein